MKKTLQFILLVLMSLVLFTACSQSQTPVPADSAPAAQPQTTDEDETAPQRDLSDLSLVGHTGRPQFLNSFATW
jgi:hypothetical protein